MNESDSAERDFVYAKSPLTGTWYRVYEYERQDGGKLVAKQKEQVPDEWIEATEEAMSDD